MHNKAITRIRYVFQGTALFDGRSDYNRYHTAESAQKYAILCQQALEQSYPDAIVQVVDADVGRASPGLVGAQVDDQLDHCEVDAVEQICDEVYGKFMWEVPRRWLGISEAHKLFKVPIPAIRWACTMGLIAEAERIEGRWEFPLDTFVGVLDNEPLVGCEGIVGVGIEDDGTYRFKCYPDDVLNAYAADLPTGVEILIVTLGDSEIPLFNTDNCSLLIATHVEYVDLVFEHFGSEMSWEGMWTYDTYARALVAQAIHREIESECDGVPTVESIRLKLRFDNPHLYTFREMIAESANALNGIVQATEFTLSGAPVWKEVYEEDERLFCEEILAPLLRKMGYEFIRYTHGKKEYGKDFTFSELTRFGERQHYGLQAKAGSVSGGVNSEIDGILGQIEDAFNIPYREVGLVESRYISVFIVAISGHFTENAKEKICHKMPKTLAGSVYFWDREKILTLIARHWMDK